MAITCGKFFTTRPRPVDTATASPIRGLGALHRQASAHEAQRKRWIKSVKIMGDVGFDVIALDYATTKFADHLSLLSVAGEWETINKTCYAEPKAKP